MRKPLIVLGIFVFLFLGWQFYLAQYRYSSSAMLGKPATTFETQNVRTGENLNLKDIIGKKVILLNFWATWCSTCRQEIGPLNQLNQTLKNEDFLLVSLLEDDVDNRDAALRLLNQYHKKLPVNFPVYLDHLQVAADKYGVFRIPESFLIDLDGNIVDYHVGPIFDRDQQKLAEKIKKLLQK